MTEVTKLLDQIDGGDDAAVDQLMPLVYEELRRLARRQMASQRGGQTLQATALVHEAYLKLTGGESVRYNNRTHFFRTAAEAMRQILIDRARRKSRQKHGSGYQRLDLQNLELADRAEPDTLLMVNEALERLAEIDPRKAELVKLRFFAGLTNAQSANALNLSLATAKRYWDFARAWLLREIGRLRNP